MIKKYERLVLQPRFRKAYSQVFEVITRWKYDKQTNIYNYYKTMNSPNELRADFYSYIKGNYDTRNFVGFPEYLTSAKGSTQIAHKCPISCCSHPAIKSYVGYDGVMYNICYSNSYFEIAFDVNGYDKGPNKWGVDLFNLLLDENDKLTTFKSYRNQCNSYFHVTSTHTNDGIGCTTIAIEDPHYFSKIDF